MGRDVGTPPNARAVRLGRAWVGPTGLVIAAIRNGELAEQLARVGLASENAETEGRTCMME
jgi:hypothetical protein